MPKIREIAIVLVMGACGSLLYHQPVRADAREQDPQQQQEPQQAPRVRPPAPPPVAHVPAAEPPKKEAPFVMEILSGKTKSETKFDGGGK